MSGVAYIETFVILGSEFGIEDYKDGRPDEDHFFPENFRARKRKRFMLWRNGGGFGQASTLKQARQMVYDYAAEIAHQRRRDALAMLEAADQTIAKLGTDPSYLFRFEHKEVAA